MYNRDNTKEAEEILGRISAELRRQGKAQAEFVKCLDLPVGTYSVWKAGRSRIFCEHLGVISSLLSVDAGWLVTGEVKRDSVDVREAKTEWDTEFSVRVSRDRFVPRLYFHTPRSRLT